MTASKKLVFVSVTAAFPVSILQEVSNWLIIPITHNYMIIDKSRMYITYIFSCFEGYVVCSSNLKLNGDNKPCTGRFCSIPQTNQRVDVSQNGLGLLYRTSTGLSIVSERTYVLKIRLMLHALFSLLLLQSQLSIFIISHETSSAKMDW